MGFPNRVGDMEGWKSGMGSGKKRRLHHNILATTLGVSRPHLR
jgi:hypothetical protein